MAILDKNSIIQKYKEFLEKYDDVWGYGNSILYDMCENAPRHDRDDVIVAKIWLIGRSYSAAVERRKTKDGLSGDEFYRIKVAPKIREISKELDGRIELLNDKKGDISGSIKEILETHLFLVNLLKEITEMEKRSFVSKYLHFHCPDMFFIYDSRARSAIRKMINAPDKSILSKCDDYEKEYADFVCRMIELKRLLEDNNTKITPRQLDEFLLYMEEKDKTRD